MHFDFLYGICVDTREKPTANLREFPRIAFFLRRRALLRLIAYAGIARRLEKCYRKNPRAGFSVVSLFFDYIKREVYGEKNRHAGFSPAFFQTACDSCIGD